MDVFRIRLTRCYALNFEMDITPGYFFLSKFRVARKEIGMEAVGSWIVPGMLYHGRRHQAPIFFRCL